MNTSGHIGSWSWDWFILVGYFLAVPCRFLHLFVIAHFQRLVWKISPLTNPKCVF